MQTHTLSQSTDQEQHPLLLWFEMDWDKACCQGHSSTFAQPWLSKAERAQALENTFWLAPPNSACSETARELERKRE